MPKQPLPLAERPIHPHIPETIRIITQNPAFVKDGTLECLHRYTFDTVMFEVRIRRPGKNNLPPIVRTGSLLYRVFDEVKKACERENHHVPEGTPAYAFICHGEARLHLVPSDAVSIIAMQSAPLHVPESSFGYHPQI